MKQFTFKQNNKVYTLNKDFKKKINEGKLLTRCMYLKYQETFQSAYIRVDVILWRISKR